MMKTSAVVPSPWYQHFWPWFIVLLLGISVIASLYTVSLAYRLGDIESPADESQSPGDSSSAIDSRGASRTPVR